MPLVGSGQPAEHARKRSCGWGLLLQKEGRRKEKVSRQKQSLGAMQQETGLPVKGHMSPIQDPNAPEGPGKIASLLGI